MENQSSMEKLLTAAWAKRRVGDYEAARSLVAQAQQDCQDDDFAALGRIYHVYMQLESDHDQYEEAVVFSKQSVSYYEKAQLPNKLAHATRHLADLHQALKQWEASETHYRKALTIYRSDPNTAQGNLANTLRGFGSLLEQVGKKTEAIRIWEETQALYQACGLTAGVEEAKQHLDELLRAD